MLPLRHGHGLKQAGDLLESFLAGGLGEVRVHGGPFLVLASGGVPQILGRATYYPRRKRRLDFQLSAFEELEEPLRMLLLLVGGLFEDTCDLDKAILLCLAGKVGIAVPGLGLAGKRSKQVLLGLGTF